MKRIVLLLILSLAAYLVRAAQPLVCTQAGTQLEYAEYDASGKLTGYSLVTVEVTDPDEQGCFEVINTELSLDKEHNPMTKTVYGQTVQVRETERIKVRPDALVLPLDQLLGELPEPSEGVRYELSGDEYAIPFDLQPGATLPDLAIVVAMTNGEKRFEIKFNVFDRKVSARERITTPAGEFEAFKVGEAIRFGFSIFKMTMRHNVWYVPGVGVVREEELSNRNKLDGYTELVAIRPPAEK